MVETSGSQPLPVANAAMHSNPAPRPLEAFSSIAGRLGQGSNFNIESDRSRPVAVGVTSHPLLRTGEGLTDENKMHNHQHSSRRDEVSFSASRTVSSVICEVPASCRAQTRDSSSLG